ncbi:MAG: hypothetical protein D6731_17605 [Planctomycetota bacterium]|nr:MAG: hypothetical protein D6731_17605 [Planctomycetota bacterium]
MSNELEFDKDLGVEFCTRFLQALRIVRLYAVDNVNLDEPLRGLLSLIEQILAQAGSVRLDVDQGTLFLNRDPVRGGRQAYATLKELHDALLAQEVGGLSFGEGLTLDALRAFFGCLKPPAVGKRPFAELKAALEEAELGGRAQVFGLDEDGAVRAEQTEIDPAAFFPQAYARTLVLVREFVRRHDDEAVRRDLELKLGRAVRDLTGLVPRFPERFLALGSVKGADAYVFQHMANTGFLAFALGYALGVTRVRLAELASSALLHALGMVDLPAHLLGSALPSPEDAEALGLHPYRALGSLLGTRRSNTRSLLAVTVAFQFARHRIPTPARHRPPRHPFAMIVRLCEEYDALTSDRQGAPARTPPQALEELLRSEGVHDPALLSVFAWLLGPYPPGTVVRLRGGEVGVVVEPNRAAPLRPVVAVALGPDGSPAGGGRLPLDGTAGVAGEVVEVLERPPAGVDRAALLLAT